MQSLLQVRCRRGFTLIESVVVMSVVSLAVIFTLGLIPTFKISNRRAGLELQAGALAQSLVEQQRIVSFSDITNSATDSTHPVDGITYTSRIRVSDVTAGKSKRVKAEIEWTWKDQSYSEFREAIVCRIPRS